MKAYQEFERIGTMPHSGRGDPAPTKKPDNIDTNRQFCWAMHSLIQRITAE